MYGNFNLVGVIHELPLHTHSRFLSAGSVVLDWTKMFRFRLQAW